MSIRHKLWMAGITLAAIGALTLAGRPAHASPALAQSKNCLACHSTDKKVLGPAFKDVAAKYKADKKAAVAIATSIQKGSSGKWGAIPMPPNAVSEAEANQLATWILSL
ncbi:cytochrome c [Cupriavidus sp. YR651]|uniref:c-type cytochrome n=1 Tax=Cupriavidus sp. YR651 TaxID=1855315 RepID=UPI000891EE75|nr:cytochrome c [Cupriavidus sp. YR651]